MVMKVDVRSSDPSYQWGGDGGGIFHEELVCSLVRVELPGPGWVRLVVPEGGCTDMGGAIRVAKRLVRWVEVVEVVSAEGPVSVYWLDSGGLWRMVWSEDYETPYGPIEAALRWTVRIRTQDDKAAPPSHVVGKERFG